MNVTGQMLAVTRLCVKTRPAITPVRAPADTVAIRTTE